MKTTIKFGVALLATGAFLGTTSPSKADPDAFTKHGLPIPGAYFAQNESQRPATVAVSKSGQGIGEQKQTVSKVGKKRAQHVRSTKRDS
jgi:hypothetical protein